MYFPGIFDCLVQINLFSTGELKIHDYIFYTPDRLNVVETTYFIHSYSQGLAPDTVPNSSLWQSCLCCTHFNILSLYSFSWRRTRVLQTGSSFVLFLPSSLSFLFPLLQYVKGGRILPDYFYSLNIFEHLVDM